MSFHLFTGTDRYLVTPELRDAVNVACALEKPLLIRGEPGTGKTVLAEAIAESLDKPLLTWNIKSTTKAQEGLYVYDTVQRLNDSRFGERDTGDIGQYIKLGPLGLALRAAQRVVLLIDEIDKADMEFPNDLLHELDRMSFAILETGEQITAEQRPIVVITSNNEKELPDAFLRRCVFHYIEFPDKNTMTDIVRRASSRRGRRALAPGLAAILLAPRSSGRPQASLHQRADRLDRRPAPRRHLGRENRKGTAVSGRVGQT